MRNELKRSLGIARKALLYTCLSFAGIFLLGIVLAYFFEDKIKGLVIKELNTHLKTELHIKSEDIELSFIRHFPYTSLSFSNFSIHEPLAGKKNLLEAGNLSLLLNPLELIQGEYKIYRLLLKDADCWIHLDKDGKGNFEIWKSSASQSNQPEGNNFSIDLRHISLQRVKFRYLNERDQYSSSVTIHDAGFSGRFTADAFDMKADAKFMADDFSIGQIQYIHQKEVKLKCLLAVNNKIGSFSFREGQMAVDNAKFSVSGGSLSKSDGLDIEYYIKSEDADIQTLISLLPSVYSHSLADYSSDGRVSFHASIKGMVNSTSNPAIYAGFEVENARIKDHRHELALDHVNATGSFTNGSAHNTQSSSLQLRNFSAILNGRAIGAQLTYSNFSDPFLQASCKGTLDLSDVKKFAGLPQFDTLLGELIVDASFKGRINDLKAYATVGKTTFSGTLQAKALTIIPHGSNLYYRGLTGDFTFDGNNLDVKSFSGHIARSDFDMKGTFKNLASFLFLPNQKLEVQAGVRSHYIYIDDFIIPSDAKKDSTHFDFPNFILFDFNLIADQIKFRRFSANDLKGSVAFHDNTADLKDIRCRTMNGEITLDGQVTKMENNRIRTTGHSVIRNIDISALFYQLENFGQIYFTDKNIKGTVSATVDYASNWNSDFSTDPGSIYALADLTIDHGQIVQFDALQKLGKFLKIKTLDQLTFNRLTNRITVQDRKIFIPAMDISCNALDMSITGTHTFDNMMDYRMKMNVSQLLFGKKKEYEDEFGTVEVDEKGGIKVMLTMKGPATSPKIAYDGVGSGKNFAKGLKQEKEDLKKAFSKQPELNPDGSLRQKEDLNKVQNDDELNWNEDSSTQQDNRKQENLNTESRTDQQRKNALKGLKDKLILKRQ